MDGGWVVVGGERACGEEWGGDRVGWAGKVCFGGVEDEVGGVVEEGGVMCKRLVVDMEVD